MTYNTFSKSSPRHGAMAASREGGGIAIAMAGVILFGGALLATSGCGRSPEGMSHAADANANANANPVVAVPTPSTAPSANSSGVRYVNNTDTGEALVSGTSTLHNWTVKSGNIKGTMEVSGPWDDHAVGIQSIDLSIPVDSLKSTEGSGMDNTMYDALKLKSCPTITYKLTRSSLKSSPTKDNSAYHFNATGQLTVAGGAHQVDLDLAVVPHDNGKLMITTDVGLKMTDFGVKPPTAMFGAIKSGDAITVKVTWHLIVQPPAARTGQ